MPYDYDVALSFAGENRLFVEAVAASLISKGLRVFYDKYEEVDLWGKDLYQHLDSVYRTKAKYCIIFISSYYADKLWTNHELRSAQARAFEENKEYILPARFDNTELPGVLPTTGYVNLVNKSSEEFASLIVEKVQSSKSQTINHIPTQKLDTIVEDSSFASKKCVALKKIELCKPTLKRG